jgi:hypothetical protein
MIMDRAGQLKEIVDGTIHDAIVGVKAKVH